MVKNRHGATTFNCIRFSCWSLTNFKILVSQSVWAVLYL